MRNWSCTTHTPVCTQGASKLLILTLRALSYTQQDIPNNASHCNGSAGGLGLNWMPMIHMSNPTYTVINTWSISCTTLQSKGALQKLRATELVNINIHHLSYLEVHLHVNINPQMNPVLKQINFVHTLTLYFFNPLNPKLNPICYLLALLAHHFLHVSRIRVKLLTFRLLMSYIYGAHILDVSRSHMTTHHSR